eukprot:1774716-Rhodomonas_salina.1
MMRSPRSSARCAKGENRERRKSWESLPTFPPALSPILEWRPRSPSTTNWSPKSRTFRREFKAAEQCFPAPRVPVRPTAPPRDAQRTPRR